jgi:hypothetical protein
MSLNSLMDRLTGKGPKPANAPVAPTTTATPVPMAKDTAPAAIWSGVVEGRQIRWTADDITVRPANPAEGKPFSAKEAVKSQMKELNGGDWEAGSQVEARARIKSVVGSIMTLEQREYANAPGVASPGLEGRYVAYDLANPGKQLQLTDVFPEADVYKALMGDKLILDSLKKTGAKPSNLKELMDAIAFNSGHCEYGFDDSLLTRFAFHHVEGNRVAVRIGLSDGAGACRGNLTQIGIFLPIPEKLKPAIEQAGKDGTLAADLGRKTKGQEMKAVYATAK